MKKLFQYPIKKFILINYLTKFKKVAKIKKKTYGKGSNFNIVNIKFTIYAGFYSFSNKTCD